MEIQEAEWIIAEWLGYVYVDPAIKRPFQDDGIGGWRRWSHGESASINFSSDANLWFGEDGILAEMGRRSNGPNIERGEEGRTLELAFWVRAMAGREGHGHLAVFYAGPGAWTLALAAAIQENAPSDAGD